MSTSVKISATRRVWRDTGIVLLLTGILIGGVLFSKHGGYLHPESTAFLMHYNSTELLPAIFDPERADWGNYQARELSYLLDWCDARLIGWSISQHIVHFFSAANVVLLLLTVLIQQLGMRLLMPKLGRGIPAILSLGFAAAQVSDNFNFFRSAKPLVAFGVTVLAFGFYALWHYRKHLSKLRYWLPAVAVTGLLLPFCDRQGCFYVAVFTMSGGGVLMLELWCKSSHSVHLRTLSVWCLYGLGVVILAMLYNLFGAPCLIEYFHGYRPDFGFQNFSEHWGNVTGGAIYLLDNVGFLFGRATGLAALALGVAILLILYGVGFYRAPRNGNLYWYWGGVIFLLAAGVSACMMVQRHPLLLRDDVIHSGYFLPTFAWLIFFIALVGNWSPRCSRKNIAFYLGIVLLFSSWVAWLVPVKPEINHLEYYQKTAPYVRYYLKHPEKNHREFPLPYSAVKLIDQFKKSSH